MPSELAAIESSPFLQSVRDALLLRHYSGKTIEAYIGWIRRFVLFHDRRHPRSLGAPEVTAFLSDLARHSSVSASTQNQALAALLFLYAEILGCPLGSLGAVVHAKRPTRLPVVMTRAEVDAVLSQLDGVWRLMASAPARMRQSAREGCGLRWVAAARAARQGPEGPRHLAAEERD